MSCRAVSLMLLVQKVQKNCRGIPLKTIVVVGASLALLGLLIAGLLKQPEATGTGEGSTANRSPLMVYCAASNKSVMEAIRQDYEREFGQAVEVQYGASQTLLASLSVSKTGDLFLPADVSFFEMARKQQLLSSESLLAEMQAVAAVPKGNPKQIRTLRDLLRDDIRVAQGSPDGTAIGKLTKAVLSESSQWKPLEEHTRVFKTTIHEVASDVKIGAADVGIVSDAVLHDYDSLEAVTIPELASVRSQVGIAVLNFSSQPREASHFARYMSARDKGQLRYREFGFQVTEGDLWKEQPELTLYAGSMLRPAIEETINEFEQREGVRVTRVYNGCGILVAQMKAGQIPDAYFACDVEFMNQVKELFPVSEAVSQNELVILVKKGNPFGIKSLKDLAQSKLRVGIGHEKQCAMGWITQRTFAESGLQSELMRNVVVQTPTGDMLVNQMRTGSLDAAVAYLSNAAGSADFLDAIRIQGLPCSVATQPYGVAKESTQKQLSDRLLQAIRAESSKKKFANEGFRWLEQGLVAHE